MAKSSSKNQKSFSCIGFVESISRFICFLILIAFIVFRIIRLTKENPLNMLDFIPMDKNTNRYSLFGDFIPEVAGLIFICKYLYDIFIAPCYKIN